MYNFITTCLAGSETLEDCSYQVASNLGINFDHVQTCVQDSFGTTEAEFKKLGFEADNSILKDDAKEIKKLGIYHNPAITINDALYRGDLDG